MINFQWLRGGRSARGTPSIRRKLSRHPLLLPVLTLVILSQTGCQSGMFGPCGSCSARPLRALRERVFSRVGVGGCYGGGVVAGGGGTIISDVPVVEGAPAIVGPSPVTTPGSALPAPNESSPLIEPLPSATPAPSSNGGGAGDATGASGERTPAGKATYEAARPRYKIGRYRGNTLSRTYAQKTPAPTTRSAQGSALASRAVASRATEPRPNELSLLDNLPPLDLPRDEGRSEIRTAAVTTSDREHSPSDGPEAAGIEVETTPAPTAVVPSEVTVAPGLRRFAVVEPKLAGGSVPAPEGLDWLAEKGYKTLVDLREPSEVPPSFIAEASRRGLRYISLPMSLATVDNDHVTRFHFEISLDDTRPLYFFDADGNRAGMLWFIDRMTVKNASYDPEEASRQAEEVGLVDAKFRQAAQRYLDVARPKAAMSSPAPTAVASTSSPKGDPQAAARPEFAPDPTTILPDESKLPEKHDGLVAPEAASLTVAKAAEAPKLDAEALRDPNAWRPLLALLLAAMGVPAAYWSRSIISFRGVKRASLPGPGRRFRSLPAGSGE